MMVIKFLINRSQDEVVLLRQLTLSVRGPTLDSRYVESRTEKLKLYNGRKTIINHMFSNETERAI